MDDLTLVSHLRMEGKYYIQPPSAEITKHMHVIFDLNSGMQLRYNDTRKFGRMEILSKDHDFSHYKDLGPEPFDKEFNASYVHAFRKGKKTPLKSHLRPGRSCANITKKDEEHIVSETQRILKAAIKAGGTTIRSYTSSLGVTGRFQTSCTVHMQKICARCGAEIKVKYIGGRSSYYCPHCQH
jgi:formamidopyrimidine-DNA glycosylase